MASENIDELSIEVSASTERAISGFDKLTASLERLDTAVSSSNTFWSITNKVDEAGRAIQKVEFGKLKELNEIKVSKTIGTNLTAIVDSTAGLSEQKIQMLRAFVTTLVGLSVLKGVTISKTIVSRLQELPEAIQAYKNVDMRAFITQVNELNSALIPLVDTLTKYGAAVNAMPKSLRTMAAATRTVVSTNKILNNTTNNTNVAITNQTQIIAKLYAKGVTAYALLRRAKGYIENFINESNTYIENMNLFAASMGKGAEAATEFGMKAQNLLGIDFGEWARNQGVFQTLITGMGVVSEKSELMSQQLTQLGYDIASFYNISVEEAMTKIQSGVAGELEPLRRLGWDLSNARMNLELTKMGIEGNAQSMTQAEKVALRYYLIMNQVTQTHGDMARTIASPANQLRVLQAQLTITARAIGNLFIPALNMILPTVIAVVKAIRILAQELANFFGWDVTFEVDYSSLDTSGIATATDDLEEGLEDSNKKAKELKNTILGFDEINKMNDNSNASDANNNGAGSGLGLDLPIDTYDFFEGLTDDIAQRTDEMARQMVESFKKVLPIVAAIGGAIAAWKLGTGLLNGMARLKSSVNTLRGGTADTEKNLNKASKTKFKNIDDLSGKITILPGSVSNFIKNLGKSPKTIAKVAGGVATVALGVWQMYENSEYFRKGIGRIWEAVQGVGSYLLTHDFKDILMDLANGIVSVYDTAKSWISSINIDLSWLGPVEGAFSRVFGQIGEIGAAIVDAFDLNAGDAAMIIGGFIDPLAWGFESLTLGVRVFEKGFDPVIHRIDELAGVSEETASRFGTSMDSMYDAILTLDTLSISDAVVSQEDKDRIARDVNDIVNTIINNLDANRNEALKSIDALSEFMPEDEIESLKKETTEFYDAETEKVREAANKINDILENGLDESGRLTSEAKEEVFKTLDDLGVDLAESAGATKNELEKIQENLNANLESATAEAASNLLQEAARARDEQVATAWDGYRSQMEGLEWLRDTNPEKYAEIEETARNHAEKMTQEANDQYYGSGGILEKCESALGEMNTQIDRDSGRMLSSWEYYGREMKKSFAALGDYLNGGFLNSCSKAWDKFMSMFSNLQVNAVINTSTVGSGAISSIKSIGSSVRRFASGGFPDDGQLFIARENGPEMVGQLNGRSAVANNQQIVDGIKQGVASAMLHVMSVTGGLNNQESDQPITLVMKVGESELGRATYKSIKQLERRGEIDLVF